MSHDTPAPVPPVPQAPPASLAPPAPPEQPQAPPATAPDSALEDAPEPDSEPGSGLESEPEPDSATESGSGPESGSAQGHAPRRRGRTALLIACAAVLGVLAGGGLGYRVQYERKPTPLPPLTGPMPAQPKGAAPPAPSLVAADDRAVGVYDADLLKLLVPAPKGSKYADRHWMSLDEEAGRYTDPAWAFTRFAANGFRRSAVADWQDADDRYIEFDLVQFRDDELAYAPTEYNDTMGSIDVDPRYGDGVIAKGASDAMVWPSRKPKEEAGYEPRYEGRGVARVGDIDVEVFVDSTHPVKAATMEKALDQQLERL